MIGVPSRREGRQYVGQSVATPCRISARILVLGPSLGDSWVSLAGSWDRFACFADREPERVKSRRDTPRCLTLQFHVRFGSSVCQSLRLLGLRTRCSRAWLLRRTHQRLTLALLCPVSIDVWLVALRRSCPAEYGTKNGDPDGRDPSTGLLSTEDSSFGG